MEIEGGGDFCFPQLSNISCRKLESSSVKVLSLYIVLSITCLLSVTLNMLIIISISHFRYEDSLIILKILIPLICLITLVLNLLVIISFSHFRQLHTPTNILLLSLAVSDFLVGLLLMPGEMLRSTACWFLGDLMCSLYKFVAVFVSAASVGDMVLISIDRYVAICDALRYPSRVTVRRAIFSVFLCWLCSAFYGGLLVKDDFVIPGRHNSCYGECLLMIDYIAGFIDIFISFIIPVTTIVVMYIRVFVVALSHARAMRSRITAVALQHSAKVTRRQSELKAAMTLGVLVAVFLLCFCPYYVISLAGGTIQTGSHDASLVWLFFFLNSCINPVLYALFFPWFRKTVKLIVTFQILWPGSQEANIL